MPGLTIAPRTQHAYVYAGNDPVNKIDPLGLSFFSQAGAWIKGQVARVTGAVNRVGAFLQRSWNSIRRDLSWDRHGFLADRILSLLTSATSWS